MCGVVLLQYGISFGDATKSPSPKVLLQAQPMLPQRGHVAVGNTYKMWSFLSVMMGTLREPIDFTYELRHSSQAS